MRARLRVVFVGGWAKEFEIDNDVPHSPLDSCALSRGEIVTIDNVLINTKNVLIVESLE